MAEQTDTKKPENKPMPVLGRFKNIIMIPDKPIKYNVEEEKRKNIFIKDKDGRYVCNKHDIRFLPREYQALLKDLNTVYCPQDVVDGLLEMYKTELEQNVSINAWPNSTQRIDNTKYIVHDNMVYAFYNTKATRNGELNPDNTIVSFMDKSGLYNGLRTIVREQLIKEFEQYKDKEIDGHVLGKVFDSLVYEKDIPNSVDKFEVTAQYKKDSSNGIIIVMSRSIYMGTRMGFMLDSDSMFQICEMELEKVEKVNEEEKVAE